MALQLTPEQEQRIQAVVNAGAYPSAREALDAAVAAVETEERWTEEERRALDEKIDRALEQVAAGQSYSPEEARRKLAEMRGAHLAKARS